MVERRADDAGYHRGVVTRPEDDAGFMLVRSETHQRDLRKFAAEWELESEFEARQLESVSPLNSFFLLLVCHRNIKNSL